METTDAALIPKLHAMRAAQGVFEHDGRRWVITRISANPAAPGAEPSWSVYAKRARR